jgi:hypothetical protein
VRRLVGLATVFVLAGCGAAVERAADPVVPNVEAPPISRADEAPPDDVLFFLKTDFGEAGSSSSGSTTSMDFCSSSAASGTGGITWTSSWSAYGPSCPQPTPEEQARMRAQEQRFQDAIRPAPGSAPRVVAKLALDGGAAELFTAWKNSSGALCWVADEVGPHGGGGGGPSGPCVREAEAAMQGQSAQITPPCDAICLESGGGSTDNGPVTFVLAGTVAADAEAIRVTLAGGATATYPLAGPTVLDTDRRVFMLHLGTHDWRKLELVRGDAVAETSTVPAIQAAFEDCGDQIGPRPEPPASADQQAMTDAMRPYDAKLTACVQASGAVPPAPFAPPSFP